MILRLAFFYIVFLYSEILIRAFTASFNASNDLPFKIDEETPNSLNLLEDVLKKISVKEKWNLEDIRVSDFDLEHVRVGSLQRYEIRLRIRKTGLLFKFSDEVSLWRKVSRESEFEPLVNGVSSKAVLDTFKLEGPFELRVNQDDKLSLTLPNITHTGLQRLLVGEGITVEVKGAQEVSIFHASNILLPANENVKINLEENHFWPFRHVVCIPLLPITILGSASLVAYRTRNPNSGIKTTFRSQNIIELLPEKCYSSHLTKKQTSPIESLNPRLALLKKLLKSFLGDKIIQNGVASSLKAKVIASTVVHFQLELEREIKENDAVWSTLAEWRTKPSVERVWFKVMALVEEGRLKPLMFQKVRPFIRADSIVWRNLLSNFSFSKPPSFFPPPEALTLDVKW